MPDSPSWIRENEVTLVVAGVGIVYPNIFNLIGIVEAYHPGVQLRWQLARFVIVAHPTCISHTPVVLIMHHLLYHDHQTE